MAEAWWNDTLIARSDDIVTVEGNAYFPAEAVSPGLLKDSATATICPWKGTAHYYSIDANGAQNRDAVWYYPDPKPAAKEIGGRVAFWKGVEVR
jgi:uncharacterized protein (DUF427 family)